MISVFYLCRLHRLENGRPSVDHGWYPVHRREHPALRQDPGPDRRNHCRASHFHLALVLLPEPCQAVARGGAEANVSSLSSRYWQEHPAL